MTHFARSTVTLLSALVAAACALPAIAQEGAAAGPPAMTCQNPGDRPPLDRASPDAGKFQKRLDDYKACVGLYAKTNGTRANEIAAESREHATKADALAAQSRAYGDAANKAVNEFNAYVSELNKSSDGGGSTKSPSGGTSAPKY
jgi:hypothetical protein